MDLRKLKTLIELAERAQFYVASRPISPAADAAKLLTPEARHLLGELGGELASGDWQAASKCPEKEADIYEKYAAEHPQSPAAAEALYDAAWRRSALIEIYKTEAQPKKSEESKGKAIALAQKAVTQGAQSDWGARAQRLLFMIEQGVPTYGNATD